VDSEIPDPPPFAPGAAHAGNVDYGFNSGRRPQEIVIIADPDGNRYHERRSSTYTTNTVDAERGSSDESEYQAPRRLRTPTRERDGKGRKFKSDPLLNDMEDPPSSSKRTTKHRAAQVTVEDVDEKASHSDDPDESSRLRARVKELEHRLQNLADSDRAPTPPPAVLAYQYTVFHVFGKSIYLDRPKWAGFERTFCLRAEQQITDRQHYLDKHPEVAFVFYKEYDDRLPRDLRKIQTKDGVLRDAEPSSESLQMVDNNMLEAATRFIEQVPEFDDLFPDFDVEDEIEAPYLFMYHSYRYVEDICKRLDHLQSKLVRLLRDAIWQTYGEQYVKADRKAEMGLVTKELLRYLIKPGDVLVQPNELSTQAYRAISWLDRPESIVVGKDDNRDIPTWPQPRTQKRSLGEYESKILHKFGIRVWSFSFDGVFEKTTQNLTVEISIIYEEDDFEIKQLNLFPIDFADEEMRVVLEKRGQMFWKCRQAHLVSYEREDNSGLHHVCP